MRTVLLAVALAVAPPSHASEWEAQPATGRIVVNVYKKGLFSAFAHDHHFEATRWRATVSVPDGDPASARVKLVVQADSLRDRQEKLSEEDRRKVNATAAGAGVLDAEHHPRIELTSERVEITPGDAPERIRGTLHGTLSLRGKSVPVDVPFDAERRPSEWRLRGKARFKQTAFGIEPFSGFGGTVSVKDEVEVDVALILRPPG